MTVTDLDDAPVDAVVDLGEALDDEAPERSERAAWTYWVALAGLIGVGAFIRIMFALTDDSLTNDSTAYLEAGRNLVTGHGFIRNGTPELHFPPVTALYLGSAWQLLGDPLMAYGVSTVLAGTVVLLPLAAIARRLGGDRAALAAAGLGALAPGLATEPALAGGGSEGPYLFFVLVALWSFGRFVDTRGSASTGWAAATAAAIAVAYLTRPEAVFIAAGLGLLVLVVVIGRESGGLIVRLRRPTVLKAAAAFGFTMLMIAAPYVVYLHSHTGHWSPTAKSQDASMQAWKGVATGDRRSRDEVLYQLDDTGFQFVADRRPLLALAKDDPGGFGQIVRANAGNLVGVFTEAPVIGLVPRWKLVPLPLVVVALVTAWRRRRDPAVPAMLMAGSAALLTGLVFFVQPRYLLPGAAVLVILAAVGLVGIPRSTWRVGALAATVVLLAAPYVTDIGRVNGAWDPREQAEHQLAGQWIAEHSVPGERVMTRAMVVAFYGERETVAMPYSTYDQLLAFARHHGVTYIVLDQFNLNTLRPQLAPLFGADPSAWPGLEVVHEIRYRGRLTRIFILDPPTSDRSSDAPGLGFVGDG